MPQACAISVALLDHGENVPTRGTTHKTCGPLDIFCTESPDNNNASRR
jgi:hypothetical protein